VVLPRVRGEARQDEHRGGEAIRALLIVLAVVLLSGWDFAYDQVESTRVLCGDDVVRWVASSTRDAEVSCAVLRAAPEYALLALAYVVDVSPDAHWLHSEWEMLHGRAQRAYVTLDSLVGVIMWPRTNDSVFVLMFRIEVLDDE
jgi:hypothetical protein